MNIQDCIDSYAEWLKSEISYRQVGDYYEINTPFLDNDNGYLQFYVKQDGQELFFTDDGFTINALGIADVALTRKRQAQLSSVLNQYGVQLDEKQLILKSPANQFAQKIHAFIQCMIRVSDIYLLSA